MKEHIGRYSEICDSGDIIDVLAEDIIGDLALGDLDEAIKTIQELKSKSEKTDSIKKAFFHAIDNQSLVVYYNMRKAAIHGDVIEDITHYGREYIDPIHKFTEKVRRLVEK